MQSDRQARERRPLVGTARRRRAAARTPSSGVVRLSAGTRRSASSGRLRGTRLSLRFAQRCRPEVSAPSFPAGVSAETPVIPVGDTPFAALPVPARHPFPAGVRAETGVIRDLGDTRFRCALRSGADRRSAQFSRWGLPCRRVIPSRWGTCRDGRHTGPGRYAVSRPCGPRCRCEHRRSRARQRRTRKNPGAEWPRGSRLFQIRLLLETPILTSPRT